MKHAVVVAGALMLLILSSCVVQVVDDNPTVVVEQEKVIYPYDAGRYFFVANKFQKPENAVGSARSFRLQARRYSNLVKAGVTVTGDYVVLVGPYSDHEKAVRELGDAVRRRYIDSDKGYIVRGDDIERLLSIDGS